MTHFVIDDPMLALIARFSGCCEDLDLSQEEFLQEQLQRIRDYVGQYPLHQQQERALEWISRNAEQYRRNWLQQEVAHQASASRCPDCPLRRADDGATCEIHERWLELLGRYVAGGTSSQEYVDETLELLRRHKSSLCESIQRVINL